MNDTQANVLQRYRIAYIIRNGSKEANSLELSFKRGWYYIGKNPYRRGQIERMIKTLRKRSGEALP